jgi:hypothetical protein
MQHPITIVESKLSDGSLVYAVQFGGADLPCITYGDAICLADTLAEVIEQHTNETTCVTCVWA